MTPEEKYNDKLKWFKSRIGKKVYRNKNTCTCCVCKEVFENGLIISNATHATYLTDISMELNIYYYDELVK